MHQYRHADKLKCEREFSYSFRGLTTTKLRIVSTTIKQSVWDSVSCFERRGNIWR